MKIAELSPDSFHLEFSKIQGRRAFLAAAPVAFCLSIGYLSGYKTAATIAGGSAFTIGFGAFNALSHAPVLSMSLTTAILAAVTVLGSLCGLHSLTLYAGTLAIAATAGLLFATGKHASWIGLQAATFFIVAAYFPMGWRFASDRAMLVIVGGIASVLLPVCGWFFEPRGGLDQSVLRWRTGLVARREDLARSLHPRSPAVQHGIRLVLALGASTALYQHLRIHDGYWIPMTALLVMRPDWRSTRSRGVARMGGTLIGAGLASVLVLSVSQSPLVLLLLAIGFMVACYSLQQVNYALFCCVLTAYVVSLVAFGGFSEHRILVLRLACTLAGGTLGLILDGLWPRSFQLRS